MPSDEQSVELAIKSWLRQRTWTLVPTSRNGVDIRASKAIGGVTYDLLVEVKGEVGPEAKNPVGQRRKYVQHALGQLIIRTGPKALGYGPNTLLAVAFPARCSDGSSFYVDTLMGNVAPDLRALLRLCFLFVDETGGVVASVPTGLDDRLFPISI